MNFLYKRSVLSRPRIFQEGGSNIFLGDAKPYEVAVPLAGPSSNPAVSNKPVEINTTGLADTFNKQKDLAYKWAELQYKYKELESKEGRDYLDAMMDVYKNVGNTSELIKAYGGTGSLGIYNEQSSAELSKISDLHSKAALELAARNPRGFANAVAEMAQLSTKNTDLRFKTGFLDKMLDAASKGDMGYLTKRFMDSYFNHIQDPNAVPFEEVSKQGTYALGMKIKAKDISDLLDNYFNKYTTITPVKTDLGATLMVPAGLVKTESGYILPSKEAMKEDMKRTLFMDERGKSYLYEQGINPDNPNTKELNDFLEGLVDPTYQRLRQAYPEAGVFDIKGTPMKDTQVAGGELVSVEKKEDKKAPGTLFKPEKMSEADKKVAAALAAIADKYGEGAATDPKIIDIVTNQSNYEKRQTALEERLKEMGLVPGGEAAAGKQVRFQSQDEERNKAIIKGPPTEKGLMENAGINQELTRAFTGKDGKRYIATVQPDVIEYAKQSGFPQVLDTLFDDDIRDYMNEEDADKWDISIGPFGGDREYLFEVKETGGTTGGTTSADWLEPEDKTDLPNLSPSIASIGSLIFSDAKVRPTSAYRTEEENELAKGSPTSYHRTGDALDYSWNEELFKRMTTPGDPLYERLNMLGYRAHKHDPKTIGYGTALHIHIEPYRRINRPSVYEGDTAETTTSTAQAAPNSGSQYNVQERSIEEIMEEKLKNKEKIDLSNQ